MIRNNKYCCLHGVFYQPGTLIPVTQRYGANIGIVNQLTNNFLAIDANGMSKLEAGGIYITEINNTVEKRRPSRRKSEMMTWLSTKLGSQGNVLEGDAPSKSHSRKGSAVGSVKAESTTFLRRNSLMMADAKSTDTNLRRNSEVMDNAIGQKTDMRISRSGIMKPITDDENYEKLEHGSGISESIKVAMSIRLDCERPTSVQENLQQAETSQEAPCSTTNIILSQSEGIASAPDLRVSSSSKAITQRTKFKGIDKSNFGSSEEDELLEDEKSANLSLMDFLNGGPETPGHSTVQPAPQPRKKYVSATLTLLSAVPKTVFITIDNGVLIVNNRMEESAKERVLHQISLGKVIAQLACNDDTFEVCFDGEILSFSATTTELTMKLICEINSANSLVAQSKNIHTPDQPLVSDTYLDLYRIELKQLLERFELSELEDIVEHERRHTIPLDSKSALTSVENLGASAIFVPSQTLQCETSLTEAQKSSPAESNCSQSSLKIADVATERKLTVLASNSDLKKYAIISSHDDLFRQTSEILNAAFSPNTVLMKHLSNSELGMVVRYDISADGTMGKHSIAAATLDKLIERLADEHKPDENYIMTFLHTYRHFTSAAVVMKQLAARLNVMAAHNASSEERQFVDSWRSIVRIRVISVVVRWTLELWDTDFQSADVKESIKQFVSQIAVTNDPDFRFLQKAMKVLIVSMERCFELESNSLTTSLEDVASPISSKHELLDFESEDLAQVLTFADSKRLADIKPVELLLYLWGDCKPKSYANLEKMITSFNKIGYWVPTTIVTQPDIKIRVRIIEKYIKIAKNYNTSMAIYSGLNASPVSRLKQTWSQVDAKKMKTLQELEILFTPALNYKNYRNLIDPQEQGIESIAQCVPVISIFIKDLTFMNDGNSKYFEKGMVNFGKLRTMYKSITAYLNGARTSSIPQYAPSNKLLEFMENIRSLKDKDQMLHKYSLLCEARTQEGQSLATKWMQGNKK